MSAIIDWLRASLALGLVTTLPSPIGTCYIGHYLNETYKNCFNISMFIASLSIMIDRRSRTKLNTTFLLPRTIEFIYEYYKIRGKFHNF